MPLEFFLCAVVVFASTLGLGWPLAARLQLEPAARLLASVLLSLLGIWLVAWSVYVFALPSATLWTIPALTVINLVAKRRSLAELFRDHTVLALVFGQLLVSAWCAGWLALIVSYSGGDWVGDWFGHWDRTIFFLARGPHDILFTGFDPLPSRPPLVNVIIGAWLRVTRVDFAHYQLVLSLLNSLAFLPAALLARRFGGSNRAIAVLTVLVMLNPLFVQNATYAWTKLITAAFTLAGLYFFLLAHDAPAPRRAGVLAALALGGACLAHYSAGPYVVMLALAWVAFGWPRRRDQQWWRTTAVAAGVGALLLALWFGWAIAIYGLRGTFLSNTSVTDAAASAGDQAGRVLLNLRDTLVPHFLRTLDFTPYAQRSLWGTWRDWFFPAYQMNLLFAVGSVAWAALLVSVWRLWPSVPLRAKISWSLFAAGVVLLGVGAVGSRGALGLAHICLHPLLLLALGFLAAHWGSPGLAWPRLLVAGAIFDFCLGLLLQFGIQSHLLDRWLTPDRPPADYFTSYTEFALMNLRAKHQLHLEFLGDALAVTPAIILALLVALLALALTRAAAKPPAATRC